MTSALSYAQRILHAPQRIDMILRRAQAGTHRVHTQVRSAQLTPAFGIARPLRLGHLADTQAWLNAHRIGGATSRSHSLAQPIQHRARLIIRRALRETSHR